MIQMQTRLDSADNTGAKELQCIKVLGGTHRRTAKLGDIIVCSELSRLGRNLFMIMEILNICMSRDCRLWTIKDGYRLGDDINAKVLAFAFGLSAEIERNLISQRTKEALARKRAEGVKIGRPLGKLTQLERLKLNKYHHRIVKLREQGMSFNNIARRLHLSRNTLARYVHRIGLK